jgi:hypothetical protein
MGWRRRRSNLDPLQTRYGRILMHGFPVGYLHCYFLLFSRYVGYATMARFAFIYAGKAIVWVDKKIYQFYRTKGWV